MFHRRAKKQLRELCRKMRMAEIEEADDLKCYELLREFKLCYAKCPLDKSYDGFRLCYGHYGFFKNLFPLWMALTRGNYILALHEINSITALDRVFQIRIKTALGDLLNKYVK